MLLFFISSLSWFSNFFSFYIYFFRWIGFWSFRNISYFIIFIAWYHSQFLNCVFWFFIKGYICLVTGGRVRIGYQICLKLLRAGATVITTTRWPTDAVLRYVILLIFILILNFYFYIYLCLFFRWFPGRL